MTRGLPPPDLLSVCPLSSTEFVEPPPPPKKIPGYTTEDGSPVPKHIGVMLIVNRVLLFIFYCILLSAFIAQYIEYMNMHGISNINKNKGHVFVPGQWKSFCFLHV